jgi:phosphonate transport system ATP-binding protein
MTIRIQGLNKHFANGKHALRNINLEIAQGEMVALIGAPGSGKSTLLRHIAGLMSADADPGSCIEINGRCVQRSGRIQSDVRAIRSEVGFVFQQFNLVDRLPVLINVLVGRLHRMPFWRSGLRWFNRQEKTLALEALSRVGISECHAQRASTLSGGQQQRAAIARTLVQGAKVVLADEPIASLDPVMSWTSWPAYAAKTAAPWWSRCTKWTWPCVFVPVWWRCVVAKSFMTARRNHSARSCCAISMACRLTNYCMAWSRPFPCIPFL